MRTPIKERDMICDSAVVQAYRRWGFSDALWMEILMRCLSALADDEIGEPVLVKCIQWPDAMNYPFSASLAAAFLEYTARWPSDEQPLAATMYTAEQVRLGRILYRKIQDLAQRGWDQLEFHAIIARLKAVKYADRAA